MTNAYTLGDSPQGSSLQPPAVDFIENRGLQYHAALDAQNVRYEANLGQFVHNYASPNMLAPSVPVVLTPSPRPMPAPVDDMAFWAEIFPRAMERLKCEPDHGVVATHNGEYGISLHGGRFKTSWTWLKENTITTTARKTVGKFRRRLREVMDKCSVPIQNAMKIVNIDMASPVVGFVDILLDAYRQAAQVRETTKSQFEGLPASFTEMEFNLRTFPGDQNIFEASVKVLFATFKAVENAVAFYTSHQAGRAGRAIIGGSQYQESLLQSLRNMTGQLEELKHQANLSFTHLMVAENERSWTSNAMILQSHMESQHSLSTMIESNHQQSAMWMADLYNHVLIFLKEASLNPPILLSPIPSRASTPQAAIPQCWPCAHVWDLLQIPNLDEISGHYIQVNAARVFPEDRGRAAHVIETRHFRNWMKNVSSAKLLVEGEFETVLGMSPLTILCTTIFRLFRDARPPGVISLVFFCGLHLEMDKYQGGEAMARSLVAQLLRQFPFPTVQPDSRIPLETIRKRGVGHICRLFVSLMRQLPPGTTVFCMIDGIDYYERERFLHGMDEVVMCLLDLIDDKRNVGAKLKVLLTSSRTTKEVRKAFREPETLLHMAAIGDGLDIGYARLEERMGF